MTISSAKPRISSAKPRNNVGKPAPSPAAPVSHSSPRPSAFPIVPKKGGAGEPSLGALRAAIPKECFNRSLFWSFLHLFSDLAQAGGAIYLVLLADEAAGASVPLRALAWCLYFAFQSMTFTGLWVLAHECGHGGFSDYTLVNDFVGLIVHSSLLVPYFSWQASHAKHHKHTNHMTLDEPFVPINVKSADVGYKRRLYQPAMAALQSLLILTVGWPLYLIMNASGPDSEEKRSGRTISHFDPWAPIWKKGFGFKIVISNLALVAVVYALYLLCEAYGAYQMLLLWGVPYLFVNMWLTSITFLQHTDERVAHFDESQWTWFRGAVSGTVDRTMGAFIDHKLHHIVDSHVVHHVFSGMPFYGARAATPYAKAFLGKYYNHDASNFFVSFYQQVQRCDYVDEKGGILHHVSHFYDHI